MMFLQFFVWGAWYITIGNYMSAHDMAQLAHWPYTVNPIAAIVAPFFLGLVADRYFATERVLGILHLSEGRSCCSSHRRLANRFSSFSCCSCTTCATCRPWAWPIRSRSITSTDQEKQFPLIRVFGTIGWIVAGLFIGFVLGRFSGDQLPDTTTLPLYTTGAASVFWVSTASACRTRPRRRPPNAVSIRSIIGLDALKELGSKPFYVFIVSSMLICIPLAAYYTYAPIFARVAVYDAARRTLSRGCCRIRRP